MKSKLVLSLLALSLSGTAVAEPMTQEALHESIAAYAEIIDVQDNVTVFEYDGAQLICISDANADRMRIISEIMDVEKLPVEQLYLSMHANFHSALDARYAIGDNKLYSAFIHPLSPITVEQIESAIRQVATLRMTFGTDYTSGELFFPGTAEPDSSDVDI